MNFFFFVRDPNCSSTIDIFNRGFDWIIDGTYSKDDVEEAILSVITEVRLFTYQSIHFVFTIIVSK